MVGIVLVSHSHLQAIGLQEMAAQMSRGLVSIVAAGGVDEQTMGTNAERIYQAIQDVYTSDGVLILFDLGSALLSTQLAIDMFPSDQQVHIKLSGAPMVEGTIAAAVEASLGHNLGEVNAAAEATKDMQKIL
jgi:dihydroxyacetone kinase phosphotransfer subunit